MHSLQLCAFINFDSLVVCITYSSGASVNKKEVREFLWKLSLDSLSACYSGSYKLILETPVRWWKTAEKKELWTFTVNLMCMQVTCLNHTVQITIELFHPLKLLLATMLLTISSHVESVGDWVVYLLRLWPIFCIVHLFLFYMQPLIASG